MALVGQVLAEYEWFPDEPPAIIGELVTGLSGVNIELWEDGTYVTLSSSGCSEIGNTGNYSWSTSGLGSLTKSRQQFHWRITDGGSNTVEGDIALVSNENRDGGMPSLTNKDSYIIQN